MRIGVLGPVEVYDTAGGAVPLGRAKARGLLAALVVHLNRQVGRDALVDALWGETPPAGAEATLQSSVSQLRRAFGPGDEPSSGPRLLSRAGGYVLEVDPDLVDAGRFERLVAEGAAAGRVGDAASADRLLSEALSLWRGPAYTEFADQPFARAAGERLEAGRLAALEDQFDAVLALGRHHQAVAELEALVGTHPLRERLSAQLMLALYRSGRQAPSGRR